MATKTASVSMPTAPSSSTSSSSALTSSVISLSKRKTKNGAQNQSNDNYHLKTASSNYNSLCSLERSNNSNSFVADIGQKLTNSKNHKQISNGSSTLSTASSSPGNSYSSSTINNGINNNNSTTMPESRLRRHIIEEINDDSIYTIYLKKITYTFNNVLNKQSPKCNYVTRCDQVDYCSSKDNNKNTNNNNNNDDQQSLQWETRQLRTIKAANLEHLVQYILLLTPEQQEQAQMKSSHNGGDDDDTNLESSYLLEERNNVAHAMHVLFATYRPFVYPWQLFAEIIKQKPFASVKQFNFILFYWLNNYPEDFWTSCQPFGASEESGSAGNGMASNTDNDDESSLYSEYACSSMSSSANYTSSSSHSSTINSNSSSTRFSPLTLADQLISMRHIDEEVKKHCLHLLDMKKENSFTSHTFNQSLLHKSFSKSSSIIELDTKFIAQQLTAIDLENFLALKPYTLLSNVRSKTKIEIMIRNFNLLSRHAIVTILQHSSPHLVTSHWIETAHHLRKMRNFNSLKAIIAGLTNESIYRLKNTVWNKLPRASLSTFTNLSSIVDDVNNQTMLRHTQLFIEGTSKVSLEDSFGTVPYLGTFLTDITMINTRYDNYIKLENGKKLINFEKCCKQYEVLMQMQLLQKNAIAALQQQQNFHLEPIYSLNHYLSLRSQSVPSIPRVARIFRNWFQMNESDLPSDRECYQISLSIESPTKTNKK